MSTVLRAPFPGHARGWLVVWMLWGMMASCMVGLSGCASSSSTSSTSMTDGIVTPSDEPDVRRRARLRLELASNYFAEGKTAVALDEVKQSLAIDANYGDAYNLRGLIYMRLGDARMADESFRRALSLSPNDADTQHNYGWMLCQQQRYTEADQLFARALASPLYGAKPKTLMAQGLCQMRAGQRGEAERTLAHAYELDAGNPVIGYNLAQLLFQRGELIRAQFYIRRLNNGEYANAESLWLGIKVERKIGDRVAMEQLVEQLRKRFPDSRELASYERGAFDE